MPPTPSSTRRCFRPDGDDYRFAHALLREAVYTALLPEDRLALHQRAARWFADRDPVLHAEQLELAGDAGAADAYRRAAEHEAAQTRLDRAVGLAERGQALADDEAVRQALRCAAAEWLLELGRAAEALRLFETATDAARDDAERCRAETGIGACLRVLERHVEALAALDRAEAAATRAELRAPRAAIAYLRGNLYFPLGRLDECLRAHETALAAARDAGSVVDEARAESGLGDAYYQRGDMPAAGEHFARCIELARAHDLGRIEAANLHMHGLTLLYDCDATGALRAVEDAVARTHALGAVRAELVARTCICDVGIWVGDWPALLRDTELVEPLARTLGSRSFGVEGMATVGYALAHLGRVAEGTDMLQRAREACTGSVASFIGPLVLGMAAAATPDPAQRAAALADGEAMLAGSSVSHNHLCFRPLAMRACLEAGDAEGIEHHCRELERYGIGDALPWTRFFVAWGRALAATRPRRRRPGRARAPARRRRRPRLRRGAAAAGCSIATHLNAPFPSVWPEGARVSRLARACGARRCRYIDGPSCRELPLCDSPRAGARLRRLSGSEYPPAPA
jgi:tetratricopeptide (TPR) repeat protein